VYPDVAGALLLPLFCLCSVCKGEGGEIEGLVPIILRARPVYWVSLKPRTSDSAEAGLICYPKRWLAVEVLAPLNPVLVACHRFKRTQAQETGHTVPARDINL